MAPEKLLGEGADEVRCDIDSLGVTLFEALTLVHSIVMPEGLHQSCLPSFLAGVDLRGSGRRFRLAPISFGNSTAKRPISGLRHRDTYCSQTG